MFSCSIVSIYAPFSVPLISSTHQSDFLDVRRSVMQAAARSAGRHFLRRAISSQSSALRKEHGSFGKYTGLSKLGGDSETPLSPLSAELERVPNAHTGTPYVARFSCPEFTSICPVTGQPDFAHLVIDYIPNQWLVESKSLKLYLTSFRNHGDFHEACTVGIGTRLVKELDPTWLRIGGYWYPRGGIPIDVFYSTGAPPADVWIPDQACPPYRGRG